MRKATFIERRFSKSAAARFADGRCALTQMCNGSQRRAQVEILEYSEHAETRAKWQATTLEYWLMEPCGRTRTLALPPRLLVRIIAFLLFMQDTRRPPVSKRMQQRSRRATLESKPFKEIQEQEVAFSAMAKEHLRIDDIDVAAASLQSDAPAHVLSLTHAPRSGHEAEADIPRLTKAELAELVFEQVGLNKREAKDIVDSFFTEVSDALERGESVKLTGFGNFQLRDKASRPGHNPKTGEGVTIPARRVVTFRASQKLKTVADAAFISSTPTYVDGNAGF